jgi:hypothetical protein
MLARRGMTATTRTGREGQRRVARAGLCRAVPYAGTAKLQGAAEKMAAYCDEIRLELRHDFNKMNSCDEKDRK